MGWKRIRAATELYAVKIPSYVDWVFTQRFASNHCGVFHDNELQSSRRFFCFVILDDLFGYTILFRFLQP